MSEIPTAAAKAVIHDENGKILCLRRNIKTRDSAYWDLPGGLVEPDEAPEDAVIREVYEETRLRIKVLGIIGTWSFFRPLDSETVAVTNYAIEVLGGEIQLSDEHDRSDWFLKSDLEEVQIKDPSLLDALEPRIIEN